MPADQSPQKRRGDRLHPHHTPVGASAAAGPHACACGGGGKERRRARAGGAAHGARVQLAQVLEAGADLQDVRVVRQVVLAVRCGRGPPRRRQRAREAGSQQRSSGPLVADSSGCCHRCGRTGSQQGGKGARRLRTRIWHAAAAAHHSRSPGSGTAGRRRPQWTARTPRTCGAGTPSAWARPGGRPARSARAHWLCL